MPLALAPKISQHRVTGISIGWYTQVVRARTWAVQGGTLRSPSFLLLQMEVTSRIWITVLGQHIERGFRYHDVRCTEGAQAFFFPSSSLAPIDFRLGLISTTPILWDWILGHPGIWIVTHPAAQLRNGAVWSLDLDTSPIQIWMEGKGWSDAHGRSQCGDWGEVRRCLFFFFILSWKQNWSGTEP